MDHVLKALDEHIAHQEWLLKNARREADELRAELEKVRGEKNVPDGQIAGHFCPSRGFPGGEVS